MQCSVFNRIFKVANFYFLQIVMAIVSDDQVPVEQITQNPVKTKVFIFRKQLYQWKNPLLCRILPIKFQYNQLYLNSPISQSFALECFITAVLTVYQLSGLYIDWHSKQLKTFSQKFLHYIYQVINIELHWGFLRFLQLLDFWVVCCLGMREQLPYRCLGYRWYHNCLRYIEILASW